MKNKSTNSKETPLMQQYGEIKEQYNDAIVLFRMGDFYETFNNDAVITAKILGIVLTKRSNGAAAEVPLAGFPYHSLDNYLHKLVNAGHRVAICEQIEDAKFAKGIVKREVIEVVTPGTITSDTALNEKSNQYIGCLYFENKYSGYAILDQSTGELFIGQCLSVDLTESLLKFAPREILIPSNTVYSTSLWYRTLRPFVTVIDDWLVSYQESYRILKKHFQVQSLKGFGCEKLTLGIAAAGAIFLHINNTLNGSLNHVTNLKTIHHDGIMGMDSFSVKNLEIFRSLSTQGTHGTLIDLLDHTITNGGGRMLKQWLSRPLCDIDKLNNRLNIVNSFVHHKNQLEKCRIVFKEILDIERILGKINQNKASPRDLIGLKHSLSKVPKLKDILKKIDDQHLNKIHSSFVDTELIVEYLSLQLNEDVPASLKQGNIFRDGINNELDELRKLISGGKKWIKDLEQNERERTGASRLKIGFNKVFGYYLEISKSQHNNIPDEYIRKQTLVNSERYITTELKQYEEKVLSAEERIFAIETELFYKCCSKILDQVDLIQTNSKIINRVDILMTFAHLAIQNRYCMPKLSNDSILKLSDSRHPIVEKLLPSSERFVSNSVDLDVMKNQIHLITGPNMAGKSTYLRQIGLTVLMAQIGSFVPAKDAEIGIVDHLFTRVGASDNLAGGESTFLIEMIEASNIIHNATPQSLILLDEIGRGTATFDGLSLAWSITEYLHNNKFLAARTFFATHYHELTKLDQTLNRLENYHAAVDESEEEIVFLKKILPGPGNKSYGIHVAKMAGLPKSILERANEILLHHLNESKEVGNYLPKENLNQASLFEEDILSFIKDLKNININEITPMEALRLLDDMKKKYES
ncbi:MAG: DNA mismatch repair protein MutS [Candidatus Neomarinimicrobiota bacterium]|nr:DNA mismatch repair protein MutS [Candidatus Neomarinimicrobiota bacterium]